jgi:hypothetical protein
MLNVRYKGKIGLAEYANRKPFIRGFTDARKHLPLGTLIRDVTAAVDYERGRLFAACYSGPLRDDNFKLSKSAQQAWNAAVQSHAII